jgi:hypothetical protein
LKSRKNEVMRTRILRKRRAKLPRTLNQRTCETVAALVRVRIGLLDGPYDQRTDGSPGLRGQIPQPVVQRVRKVDSGADRHDVIMSKQTDLLERRVPEPSRASKLPMFVGGTFFPLVTNDNGPG